MNQCGVGDALGCSPHRLISVHCALDCMSHRSFQPFPLGLSTSDPLWVRGYRLSDLPVSSQGRDHWNATDALLEASRFANLARRLDKSSSKSQNPDVMKALRTWMLAYTFSDYCLDTGLPDSSSVATDGAIECGGKQCAHVDGERRRRPLA